MISIDRTDKTPLYQQLFDSCRKEIISGAFPAGSRLPALRKLAKDLGVARNTVEVAYQQLVQEGYVSSKPGGGFIVEQLDLDEIALAQKQRKMERAAVQTMRSHKEKPYVASVDVPYDFTYGDLQDTWFPAETWRKLTADALFGEEAALANRYNDRMGDELLREELAVRLARERGVHCLPEQIVIQAGTQAALMNLMRLFDPANDTVTMEDPGFDGARIVFQRSGFSLAPLPVDCETGWNMNALEETDAALAFVTPSSQFPTGKIMPLGMRQNLLAWANKHDSFIVEDDYCREFRYDSRPLPSLQSLDAKGRVIYMGTLSKALSPALRLNYLVLPHEILERWNKAFEGFRSSIPWLSQTTLRLFMQNGHWERLLRRAQTCNKRKNNALLRAIDAHMRGKVEVVGAGSGLHILLRTRDERKPEELIGAALSEGVRIYDTSGYWIGKAPETFDYMLVGFSRIREEDIAPGIAALARAWF